MKRNISRIKAMIVLYNWDLTKSLIDDDDLNAAINENLEEDIEIDEKLYKDIVDGVISNLFEIDKMINLNLKKWSIDRLSYVDRNLLRMGIYEMVFYKTPKQIVINEILNIAHEYSETDIDNSISLLNSILDRISRDE